MRPGGVPDVLMEFLDRGRQLGGTLPLQPGDHAGGDRQPQQVEDQLADRPLAQAVTPGQDAEDRPRPRAEGPGGDTRRQGGTGRSPTARAGQAMEPVLVDHRPDRWHFSDLMSDRLGVIAVQRLAAGPALGRLALEDLPELLRRDQGSGLMTMAGLTAPLLPQGGNRWSPLDRRGIRRGGLGGVGGVLVDPLLQLGDPLFEGLHHRSDRCLCFRRERIPEDLRQGWLIRHVNVLLNSGRRCNIGV